VKEQRTREGLWVLPSFTDLFSLLGKPSIFSFHLRCSPQNRFEMTYLTLCSVFWDLTQDFNFSQDMEKTTSPTCLWVSSVPFKLTRFPELDEV